MLLKQIWRQFNKNTLWTKTKNNLSKKEIRGIKENFSKLKYKFPKSKINKIRRSLYDIKNPKNLSKSKIKRIGKKSSWIRRKSL